MNIFISFVNVLVIPLLGFWWCTYNKESSENKSTLEILWKRRKSEGTPWSQWSPFIHPEKRTYCNCVMGSILSGFPDGSVVRNSTCNAGDTEDPGLILGLGRSPGEGIGNPLQNSHLENPHGQRSLSGYSLWGHRELGMTEQVSIHTYIILPGKYVYFRSTPGLWRYMGRMRKQKAFYL